VKTFVWQKTGFTGLPRSEDSFMIDCAILTQYHCVTDGHPAYSCNVRQSSEAR